MGSKIWERTVRSWKLLVGKLRLLPPNSFEEWLSSFFWWDPNGTSIGPGFSKTRVAALFRRGILFVRNS
jgi:hypothetical protein